MHYIVAYSKKTKQLNEKFKENFKDSTYLTESSHGKDSMPTVSYEVIKGQPASDTKSYYQEPSKGKEVRDVQNSGSGPKDPANQNTVDTKVAPNQKIHDIGGSTYTDPDGPSNISDKMTQEVNGVTPPGGKAGGNDPMPTVNTDVAYQTKTANFKSSYTLNHMNKESFDVSKDINALFEGSDMSDSLKEKTGVVFESILKEKLKESIEEVKTELENQYVEAFNLNMKDIIEENNINIQYGITQWMEKNALSITESIETQIAKDFMIDLKKLCESHNIIIPEGKEDIVQEMAEKITQLEEKLEAQIESNAKMMKDKDDEEKDKIVKDMSEGLTDVQFEKLKKLSENFSYENMEQFKSRVNMLKEAYFSNKKKTTVNVLQEGVGTVNDEGEVIVSDEQTKPANFIDYWKTHGIL